jgi:hypothetical protein
VSVESSAQPSPLVSPADSVLLANTRANAHVTSFEAEAAAIAKEAKFANAQQWYDEQFTASSSSASISTTELPISKQVLVHIPYHYPHSSTAC